MKFESPRFLACSLGLAATLTACGQETQTEDQIITPSVSVDVPERFSPTVLPDGRVDGAVTFYSGLTAAEVQSMEHCGNETSKVLLTFDDKGGDEHVRQIAETLESYGSGAIFFPQSDSFDMEMVDEIRSRGFWVGNHSYSHPDLTNLSPESLTAEIIDGFDSNLFRPPFGAIGWDSERQETFFDTEVKVVAESLGYSICMWTIDTIDYDGLSADEIVTRVEDQLQPGSVILMHMQDSHNTLDALPGIFAAIQDAGLETCPIQTRPTDKNIPLPLPC